MKWKICWRVKRQYRDGSQRSRRWTVYQYRRGRPSWAELDALAKHYPMFEFRSRKIGDRS